MYQMLTSYAYTRFVRSCAAAHQVKLELILKAGGLGGRAACLGPRGKDRHRLGLGGTIRLVFAICEPRGKMAGGVRDVLVVWLRWGHAPTSHMGTCGKTKPNSVCAQHTRTSPRRELRSGVVGGAAAAVDAVGRRENQAGADQGTRAGGAAGLQHANGTPARGVRGSAGAMLA